jgi:hypothetical protein
MSARAKPEPDRSRGGNGGRCRAAFLCVAMLGVLLWSSVAGRCAGASEAAASVGSIVAHLQYREVDFAPLCVEVPVAREKSFAKEPAFAGAQIFRGRMVLNKPSNLSLPFAWDIARRKIYLDLNYNGDLTDDPAGVLTAPEQELQLFRGIRLRFPGKQAPYDVLVDAHVFGQSGTPRVFLYVRSLWDGAVELNGAKWYVAVVARPEGRLAPPGSFKEIGERMILRPWAEREPPNLWWHATLGHVHDLSHVKLVNFPFRYAGNAEVFDAFALPAKLFLQGRAYRLEYEPESVGKLAVTFDPLQAPLGRLEVAGENIRRLVLDGGAEGFTAVLDSPGAQAEVPPGVYPRQIVLLQKAGFANVAAGLGTNQLAVSQDTAAHLDAGGPLRNMVAVFPRPANGNVGLCYQLCNASGMQFRLTQQDEKAPARLEIRQGDALVAQDKFRFG